MKFKLKSVLNSYVIEYRFCENNFKVNLMLKIVIAIFYFFYFANVGVSVIFFPKVLNVIGYNSLQIGIIFASFPLMKFITPFIFLKKIKLTHNLLIKALILNIIFSISIYFTIHNFYMLLLNTILFGLVNSLILPYVEAIAIEYLQKEKYGKIRLFGSIGFMIIALVIARFLEINNYYVIDFLVGTIFFTTICAYFISNHQEKTISTQNLDSEKFSIKKYMPLWISMFFMQMSFGSFYGFFTIYSTDNGISLNTTSYLWSFGVLCEIIMLYFQAPILKRFSLLTLIKFTTFITAIRWLVLFLFTGNTFVFFLSQSLHAFSFALYHTSIIMYLFSLYQNKKLAQQFFIGISYGLGGFIGSIIAGYIYGEYIFFISSVIAFISFFYLLKVKEK
jgi:PPP family 3-phenylpropionic acid transporter